jgi:hypothetical protein
LKPVGELQMSSLALQQRWLLPELLQDVFGDCVVQLFVHEPQVIASVTFLQTPPQLISSAAQQTPD